MPRHEFTDNNQPDDSTRKPRGKALKTKLFEAMKQDALLDCPENATNTEAESLFISHWAKRAFNVADPSSGTLLRGLSDKCYSNIRPCLPEVNFHFDINSSITEQTKQIIEAAASGKMPPDIAGIFLTAIKDQTVIEANTDLKDRIDNLETLLNG